jgi:hypothetical protein
MSNVSFTGLLIVAIAAFVAPLLLALTPARRLPAIVLEIVIGIVIGPSVLGWVKIDLPISILSVLKLRAPLQSWYCLGVLPCWLVVLSSLSCAWSDRNE